MSNECKVCEGKGEYVQTYTAGCGFGSYKSMGRCDYCGGTGKRKELRASPAAAVPEGALPPLPKPWQDRGNADDWKRPHNVYQTAEIAEWRARAAVEADRAQRQALSVPPFAAPASQHDAIMGAVARGWCAPENERKAIDHDLVMAITREVCATLAIRCRAEEK